MFSSIQETGVWERLQATSRPIVLYGMGDGAQKIMDTFEQYGIRPDAIFASDEFVRGHSFMGYKVHTYSEICAMYDDFIIVLAFATHLSAVLDRLRQISKDHEIVAPDVPVAGGGLFTRDYFEQHADAFRQAYNTFADAESRKTFTDILNFKISGKISYLFSCFTDKNSVYRNILKVGRQERFVDLGAYDGDTIRELLDITNGQYQSITAVEPDTKNYNKLCRYIEDEHLSNIQALHLGIWSERTDLSFASFAGRNSRVSKSRGTQIPADSVDNLLKGEKATFIKMDVEGCELHALEGAKHTIRQYKPKLYVCAYHRNDDLFALPLKIKELYEGYSLYLRHSPYIPAWETNIYAVCEEDKKTAP